MHLELISTNADAPGTGAAATPFTGDSLTIKNSKSRARILAVWNMNRADGFVQITKPSGHDTTRGWRQVVDSANIMNLLPAGIPLGVEPQETLNVTIAGGATPTELDLAMIQVLYDDLPGVQGRFINWTDLLKRAQFDKINTVQCNLTGAAAGYTGEELITVDSDLLRANRDYAVLGITTNVPVGAVYIFGPDTGYQRCAVPGGVSEADYGRDWFCALSRASGEAVIPIINSGNKFSTTVGFVQNEINVSPQISISLALLSDK